MLTYEYIHPLFQTFFLPRSFPISLSSFTLSYQPTSQSASHLGNFIQHSFIYLSISFLSYSPPSLPFKQTKANRLIDLISYCTVLFKPPVSSQAFMFSRFVITTSTSPASVMLPEVLVVEPLFLLTAVGSTLIGIVQCAGS